MFDQTLTSLGSFKANVNFCGKRAGNNSAFSSRCLCNATIVNDDDDLGRRTARSLSACSRIMSPALSSLIRSRFVAILGSAGRWSSV